VVPLATFDRNSPTVTNGTCLQVTSHNLGRACPNYLLNPDQTAFCVVSATLRPSVGVLQMLSQHSAQFSPRGHMKHLVGRPTTVSVVAQAVSHPLQQPSNFSRWGETMTASVAAAVKCTFAADAQH
jgi:hypothetical protein